jgi:gliding motility-associated-like protein
MSNGKAWHTQLVGLAAILFLSVSGFEAYGQSPCFDADVTRGCAPLTVSVIDCSNGGVNLTYNFNAPGSVRGTATTFTYTRPGRYAITQYGTFGATGDSLRRNNYIEVLATPEPVFTLSPCANREAFLQITDNVYNSFVVDWGDGVVESVPAAGSYRHTYPNVNPRTVQVSGVYAGVGCGGSRTQAFNPIVNLPAPVLVSLTTLDNNSARLNFQAEAGTLYSIERRDETTGNYTEAASLTSQNSGLVGQVLAGPQPATYRVVAVDACGNRVPSDEISSVVTTATAADGVNQVTWQTNPVPTFLASNLLRDNQLLQANSVSTVTGYDDNAVVCGTNYCYRVEIALSGGARAVSQTACVRAVSTAAPPPVTSFSASVVNNQVVLNWTVPTNGTGSVREFIVSRSGADGQFSSIARISASSTSYVDADSRLDVERRCYRLSYLDNCGNASASTTDVCPMRLTAAEARNPADSTIEGYQLNWSEYVGGDPGTEYSVEKLNASDGVVESETQPPGTQSFFFPLDTTNQLLRFRIVTTGANGSPIASNIVEIRQNARIFVPDAFSPNGDGTNDRLDVKGLFINAYRIVVYNRWGEIVFSSNNRGISWDGRNNLYSATAGTYAYIVRIEDQLGREVVRRGNVLLLR